MNKIQLFYDNDLVALQQKINEWLSKNKEINIVATDITSMGKPSLRAGVMATEKYVFYLLYTEMGNNALTMERSEEAELPQTTVQHLEGNMNVAGIHN